MHRCAALALLATAHALSTTTLKPPTITATEKQVIACVDRVQHALDELLLALRLTQVTLVADDEVPEGNCAELPTPGPQEKRVEQKREVIC